MEVTPTFIFEERERLASLLCQNRDVMEMSEYEVYENRLNVLQDIISLCGRREAPRQVSRQAYEESIARNYTIGVNAYRPLELFAADDATDKKKLSLGLLHIQLIGYLMQLSVY
jgi:hypothetical protein